MRTGSLVSLVAVTLLASVGCAADEAGTADEEIVGAPPASSAEGDPLPGVQAGAEQAGDVPEDPPELVVHSLANIGDSISQGFDADDSAPLDLSAVVNAPNTVFKDDPALSWVKGTDERVGSVADHYRKLDPELVLTSVSRSGNEMVNEFESQARKVIDSKASPDLVYTLMGGNDICNRPRSKTGDPTATLYPVAKWREAIVKGLTVLAGGLRKGGRVRILSMPRTDLLYTAAEKASVPVIATINTPAGPLKVDSTRTCKQIWTAASAAGSPICGIVTTEGSAEKRALIGKRIDQYNDVIAEEVRRFNADAKLNPSKVVFETDWTGSLASGAVPGTSVGTYVFKAEHVSRRDCFHPSIAGQREIAKLVLSKKTWTR